MNTATLTENAPLTERRKVAMVRLANYGVEGEKVNARSMCEKLGLAWEKLIHGEPYAILSTTKKPTAGADAKKWRKVYYGDVLEYMFGYDSPFFAQYTRIAERFTKQVVADVTGCMSMYRFYMAPVGDLLVWCDAKEAKEVQSRIDTLLPKMLERLQNAYSDFMIQNDLHFKSGVAGWVPELGETYNRINALPEEVI